MGKVDVKEGVTPPLVKIVCELANLTASLTPPAFTLVITAGTNGTHQAGSLHYKGAAVDVRTKNFPTEGAKEEFLAKIRKALGQGYDCLYESKGTPNEHLHIEFDPKS